MYVLLASQFSGLSPPPLPKTYLPPFHEVFHSLPSCTHGDGHEENVQREDTSQRGSCAHLYIAVATISDTFSSFQLVLRLVGQANLLLEPSLPVPLVLPLPLLCRSYMLYRYNIILCSELYNIVYCISFSLLQLFYFFATEKVVARALKLRVLMSQTMETSCVLRWALHLLTTHCTLK